MREPDWLRVPEDNEPAPIEGKFKFFDVAGELNTKQRTIYANKYWENISHLRSPQDKIAHVAKNGSGHEFFICNRDECKEKFLKHSRGGSIEKPISFQELRKNNINGVECPTCVMGSILPARPHSQKECQEHKLKMVKATGHPDSCIAHDIFTPHAFKDTLEETRDYVHHKDLWPGGHISDEQAKAYGTAGDLETLLGSEAEWRQKNGLYLFKGEEQ
jgi:hypothetical protein